MKKILITGCGVGSIGEQVARMLTLQQVDDYEITTIIRRGESYNPEYIKHVHYCDFKNLDDLQEIYADINYSGLDYYINCTGMSHIEWFANLKFNSYMESMNVNLNSFVLGMNCLLNALSANKGMVINLISSAANIPMRCSLPYNVSKAGLQMATRQLARELTPRNGICIVGVNPSKVAFTNMTLRNDTAIMAKRRWSEREYRDAEAAGTPSGELLSRRQVAEFIINLMMTRNDNLSGSIFEFGV